MGRFFGRESSDHQIKGYEDVEGCAMTLSVLSAFVLALVVSLQYQVTPEARHYADFRGLVCRSEDFRTFLYEVLESTELGNASNFTAPLSAGKVLDVRHELQEGIATRYPSPVEHEAAGKCYKDGLVTATLQSVYHLFPAHLLNVWYSQNPEFYRYSALMERNANIAGCLLFVSLLWGALLYNSLGLSPAREDPSGDSWQRWCKPGIPCLIFGCCIFVGGLAMYFVAHLDFMATKSPFYDTFEATFLDFGMYAIVAPGAGLGGLLSIAITVQSGWAYWRRNAKEKASAIRTAGAATGATFRHEI